MAQWCRIHLQCRRCRDSGLIPRLVRSPGEGNGIPLKYSCLGNPMDRGTWWAIVHGSQKSWAWLSDSTTKTEHLYIYNKCLLNDCVYISWNKFRYVAVGSIILFSWVYVVLQPGNILIIVVIKRKSSLELGGVGLLGVAFSRLKNKKKPPGDAGYSKPKCTIQWIYYHRDQVQNTAFPSSFHKTLVAPPSK